ncbi:MAG TPA: hypothetical protein VGB98_02525, partial [Pyrinomonadaceae bacterium]
MKEFLPTSSAAGLAAASPAAAGEAAAQDPAGEPTAALPLAPGDARAYVRRYAANPLFAQHREWV